MYHLQKPALLVLRRIFSTSKEVSCTTIGERKRENALGADPFSRLIWIDLELSGLDIEKDVILEAACVITEANLDIVAQSRDLIIHQADEVLDGMNTWCQETHHRSGLLGEVVNSSLTVQKAEEELLMFVKQHTQPGTCPLAGNTVYMDRLFLAKHMPMIDQYMHYRIVDVSTVKELCRRWNPFLFSRRPEKRFAHRAVEDILESIEELKYYKQVVFDPHNSNN